MSLIHVETESGPVTGIPAYESTITVFKGIPYAQAPTGSLRWRAPQPAKPWEEPLLAYSYRGMPCQSISGEEARSYGLGVWKPDEDCLYLNVWTPAEAAEDQLPVLVWIYGGSYKTGSMTNCLIHGEEFAKRGIIVVTFNYRVGPIGYLCHPELSAENEKGLCGNYGTLDQIAALKWVHRNIAAFGGSPDKITIIGQSAGAHSVMTMCNTPLTKGLFRQAIIESTAGLSAMYYQDEQSMEDGAAEGVEMLKRLGVSSIEEARTLDASYITEQLVNVKLSSHAPWFPKTDGYVLPKGTISNIMAGGQHRIKYLCGSNSEETGNMPGFLSDDPKRVQEFARIMFGRDVDGYLKTCDLSDKEAVRRTIFEEYNNDKLTALLAWQELESRRGGENFYQYYFTKKQPGTGFGACHGAELPYVFKTLEDAGLPYDGTDYDLAGIIHSYWVNFIKTGDPNGPGLPAWERYSTKKSQIMELGESVGMIDVPWNQQRKFIVNYMLKEAEEI